MFLLEQTNQPITESFLGGICQGSADQSSQQSRSIVSRWLLRQHRSSRTRWQEPTRCCQHPGAWFVSLKIPKHPKKHEAPKSSLKVVSFCGSSSFRIKNKETTTIERLQNYCHTKSLNKFSSWNLNFTSMNFWNMTCDQNGLKCTLPKFNSSPWLNFKWVKLVSGLNYYNYS